MPDPQHKYVQKAVSRAWNLYWYWAWCWCYHRSLPELPPAPANFSKLLPTANLSSIQDTAWPCATLAQFPPKHPGCPVWVALCFGCFRASYLVMGKQLLHKAELIWPESAQNQHEVFLFNHITLQRITCQGMQKRDWRQQYIWFKCRSPPLEKPVSERFPISLECRFLEYCQLTALS